MKNWTGNKNSTWACLAPSNHSDLEREENDYYATDPHALEIFLDKLEQDGIKLHEDIWECACGEGHLSKVLENRGYNVTSTDLIDRGYGKEKDFLNNHLTYGDCDILTNPPYRYAKEFVENALDLLDKGYYAIFFLKIQFLEGQARKEMFNKYPPKYVYVNSTRQICAKNGNFENIRSSASCYCWFIWEKGYTGEPVIRWI